VVISIPQARSAAADGANRTRCVARAQPRCWIRALGARDLPIRGALNTPSLWPVEKYDFAVLEVKAITPIEFDEGFTQTFGYRPRAVRHSLVEHPLLSLDAIADLADRFPGRIERHQADQPFVVPGGAPDLDGPPSETVRGIDSNGCWMVFWYIDQVPEYKRLLDQCLDHAEAFLPSGCGPAIQREAFLFLSAPNALTPIHFDPEHNFLLQIRGQKSMHVCPFESAEAELRELDRYHDGGHRNLEALPSDGELFVLDPSDGVYVPSFMPHWVQNGAAASISLSITFRTQASRQAERVHRMNAGLRKLGLSPAPPGVSARRDQAKESVWIATHWLKGHLRPAKRALSRAKRARSQPA
jgi:hypothetical protein